MYVSLIAIVYKTLTRPGCHALTVSETVTTRHLEPEVGGVDRRVVQCERERRACAPPRTAGLPGVDVAPALPLKEYCRSYTPVARFTEAPVPLKISMALLLLLPSMYSEMNSSVGAALTGTG
jgi:hypothetical protein